MWMQQEFWNAPFTYRTVAPTQRVVTCVVETPRDRRIRRVIYDAFRGTEFTDFFRRALKRLAQVEAFDAFVRALAGDEPEAVPAVDAPHPFRCKEHLWRTRWLGRRREIT